jgi:addiction module HigA family antidote
LSITDAATALGVTRTTRSELVNGKRGISAGMAVRLSKVFGGSAESWLVQQAQYDLAHVRADRMKLKKLQLARPALGPYCRDEPNQFEGRSPGFGTAGPRSRPPTGQEKNKLIGTHTRGHCRAAFVGGRHPKPFDSASFPKTSV